MQHGSRNCSDGEPVPRGCDPRRVAARGHDPGRDPAPALLRCAVSGIPRHLSRRPPGAEYGSPLPRGGGLGVRGRSGPERTSAAHLWAVIKGPAPPPEVTAPTYRRVKGLAVHRGKRKATLWRGIPITTVPRPSSTWPPPSPSMTSPGPATRPGFATARRRRRLRNCSAGNPAPRSSVRSWTATLPSPSAASRSDSSSGSKTLGCPRPTTNRPAGTKRVDCRWPEHRLTVELDSYTFHNSRHSWEQDRLREREARQRGDAFLRFTQADLSEPAAMLADITRHTRGSR
jgi:hypothetical protein